MSTRIKPADPPYSPQIQHRLDKIMPPGVPPLVLFRVLARDERLFERFAGGSLLDRGQLSLREREIVILRVCALHGSEYEWGVHVSGFSAKAGLTPEQIAATVHAAPSAKCWSPRESLLLQVCDALAEASRLDEPLWQALSTELHDEAIVELLLLISFYRMVSTLTGVLQLPLESWAARFPAA